MSENIKGQLKCILEGTYITEGFFRKEKTPDQKNIAYLNQEYSDKFVSTSEQILKQHHNYVTKFRIDEKDEDSTPEEFFNTTVEEFDVLYNYYKGISDLELVSKFSNDEVSPHIRSNIKKMISLLKAEASLFKEYCKKYGVMDSYNKQVQRAQERNK